MGILLDKVILFIICLALYAPGASGSYLVVPVILAVIVSALGSYVDRLPVRAVLFAASVAYGVADSRFLFFLPLLCFDLFGQRGQLLALLALIPIARHVLDINIANTVQVVLIILLAWLLKSRSLSLQKLREDSIALRDANKETAMQLELKNRELLERQDYEVNLATLNERNRIAREIHDNIGHLLTRAILLTGALTRTCQDENLKASLTTLQDTLSESMDSIRDSLHDLHDQSIDLQAEIRAMLKDFDFCPVRFEYDLEHNPGKKCKYAFLAIIREALSNIVRHSKATSAEIILREHPGFYQLVVRDNGIGAGMVPGGPGDEGIGLKSIAERVASLGGLLNIKGDKGFVIFISVPKSGGQE